MVQDDIIYDGRVENKNKNSYGKIDNDVSEITEFPNNDKIQSLKVEESLKLRDVLITIVQACCKSIDNVCTVMYVLPTFFIISTKDWFEMICCLLDSRSACVHVLTVLTEYNSAWKRYLKTDLANEKENCEVNEKPKKIKKVLYYVSTTDLECSLRDFETILTEEVKRLNTQLNN